MPLLNVIARPVGELSGLKQFRGDIGRSGHFISLSVKKRDKHGCMSSVPSVDASIDDGVMAMDTGALSTGHSGGAMPPYSLRYQYHERLGMRK